MKTLRPRALCRLALLLIAFGPTALSAQDVTITPLEWTETKDAPDELPQFKNKVTIAFPAELKATPDIGYVVLEFSVDEKGRSLGGFIAGTQPLLERVAMEDRGNRAFKPGRRGGEAVFTSTRMAVIFNPATAAQNTPDATPRLLEVAVAEVKLPKTAKIGSSQSERYRVIWADVTVTPEGNVAAVKNAPPELTRALEIAAKNWRFAPARQSGVAVAADVKVPFVVVTAGSRDTPEGKRTSPRVNYQPGPVYPFAMRLNGMRGEVLVEFFVDREGRVRNAFVVRSLNPSFDDAAIDAVKQWRFEPGRIGERPVNTRMQVPVVFTMGPGDNGPLTSRGKADLSKLPEPFRYETPPKPVGTAWPVYPRELLLERKKGKATVAYVIDESGRVKQIAGVEASQPEFGRALVAALSTFTFEPALKGGRPSLALQRFEQEFAVGGYGVIGGADDTEVLRLEAKKPEKIFKLGDLDESPKPLSRKPPKFPVDGPEEMDTGEALIEFLIDEEGRARVPRSVSATHETFAYAAIHAIAGWRFEPPMRGGRTVVARVQIPIKFKREQSPPAPEPAKP